MSERLFRSLGPVMGPTSSCMHNTVLQYCPTAREQERILLPMPALTIHFATAGDMQRCTASLSLKILQKVSPPVQCPVHTPQACKLSGDT